MKTNTHSTNRRDFIKTATAVAIGSSVLTSVDAQSNPADDASLTVIGPKAGYSPQIGTLVSMLNYNRSTVERIVSDLTVEQLDYLHDPKANTVGALIMHLGATDKFYQINTFEGRQEFNESEKKIWDFAMELGDAGRANIKGQNVKYYLGLINEVRQKTLAELKKKDDKWLLAVDPEWSKNGRTFNTFWKWFHVCEHESNHRGQIAWLRSRIPGVKQGNE